VAADLGNESVRVFGGYKVGLNDRERAGGREVGRE
jgi:hypothetical protein